MSLVLSCLVLPNVIEMHARKILLHLVCVKAVLIFQTLMLAMLGKWATTCDRVLFLDFAAWINPTSNEDNLLLISVAFEVTEHILLL